MGIDGVKLVSCLPDSGTLLTGRQVPVTEQKYIGKCSVLFYINQCRDGSTWPYVRFMTFKHGGISAVFNGYILLESSNSVSRCKWNQSPIVKQAAPIPTRVNDEWRKRNFWAGSQAYYNAQPAFNVSWLNDRLLGQLTSTVVERAQLRANDNGDLIAPISNPITGLVGYHTISPRRVFAKRHAIYSSGMLKGSAITLLPNKAVGSSAIAICEGLVTGLSLALVWSGYLFIALTAGNLAAVRAHLGEHPVTFFADNDCWKPHIGNTGIRKAKEAMQLGDRLCVPKFQQRYVTNKPSDFNDLLQLQGVDALIEQVSPYK